MLSIAFGQGAFFGRRRPPKDVALGYSSGYRKSISSEENVRILERELLLLRREVPQLAGASFDWEFVSRIRSGELQLPAYAERWTLIPRWDAVANTLEKAIEQIHSSLERVSNGGFNNYRTGELDSDKLWQSQETATGLQKLSQMQNNQAILVVPMQFGLRHAGYSTKGARKLFAPHEFGLGSFEVGSLLLTHPERLKCKDDLWVLCAGDEYVLDAKCIPEKYPFALAYRFEHNSVNFGGFWFPVDNVSYGAVTAFVP